MDIARVMKLSKEYLKEKLIGLGFVLDDKTVVIDQKDIYKYNKEMIFFIIAYYYINMYFLINYFDEIDQFFTGIVNSFIF